LNYLINKKSFIAIFSILILSIAPALVKSLGLMFYHLLYLALLFIFLGNFVKRDVFKIYLTGPLLSAFFWIQITIFFYSVLLSTLSSDFEIRTFLSYADNHLLPIVLSIFYMGLIRKFDTKILLYHSYIAIIYLSFFLSIIHIYITFSGDYEFAINFLSYDPSLHDAKTLWGSEYRSRGIFNSPGETGVFFGLLLLLLLSFFDTTTKNIFKVPSLIYILSYLSIFLVFFAGVTTGSKSFVILATFLSLSYIFSSFGLKKIYGLAIFFALLIIMFSFEFFLNYLDKYIVFKDLHSFLYNISGGRFTDGGTSIINLFDKASTEQNSTIIGIGYTFPNYAFDNEYIYYYLTSGLLGLMLKLYYQYFLIMKIVDWRKLLANVNNLIVMFILAVSLAGDFLHANRISILMVFIIFFLDLQFNFFKNEN